MTPFPAGHGHDRDVTHLGVLAVFHFICASCIGLAMLLVGLHYGIMHFLINEGMKRGGERSQIEVTYIEDPIRMMQWFYMPLLLVMGFSALCNGLSGVFLLKRRRRVFSLFTAAKNCLQFPLGTALGICTIIVLNRESVRAKYAVADGTLAPSR
ncbi:hypothetical protein DES53_101282 [Roseimicrobium gellanilyticum]|uniref:Uncharacterized protein n=1 Tax=Roseimicrobium gellanilyticum TaxID=748857 RepID=A0A366HVG9_9BACT|nr:hypothetical protein [Roseimicrobium gellanilyticum]RBP47485.1 hypothetical protein DES53_101282 [Roseimicrobium gellanilyticum]